MHQVLDRNLVHSKKYIERIWVEALHNWLMQRFKYYFSSQLPKIGKCLFEAISLVCVPFDRHSCFFVVCFR